MASLSDCSDSSITISSSITIKAPAPHPQSRPRPRPLETPSAAADFSVHVLVLLEMSGTWNKGRDIAGATELAVQRVNNDDTLLPGRLMKYSWTDSGCSPAKALKVMKEPLRADSRIVAIIGPGCSFGCEVTSYLSAGALPRHLPQISLGCTGLCAHAYVHVCAHACSCASVPALIHACVGPVQLYIVQHALGVESVLN